MCKCRWNASRAFCVIHFEQGTEVASCLNLLTFFCLQCSCRQSQPFNGKHCCRFSGVRKQRACPPDLRYGRDNTFWGGPFIHVVVSAGISAFAKSKQRPFCPQSSERRWLVKSQMGSSFTPVRSLFFSSPNFFFIWKRFLFSLLGDKDRVVGKAAQNSVPLVVSKLVLYDCRHQLC